MKPIDFGYEFYYLN